MLYRKACFGQSDHEPRILLITLLYDCILTAEVKLHPVAIGKLHHPGPTENLRTDALYHVRVGVKSTYPEQPDKLCVVSPSRIACQFVAKVCPELKDDNCSSLRRNHTSWLCFVDRILNPAFHA